jgi:hypothetical protein
MGTVIHACDPSTQVKTGVRGQPELYRKNLSQKTKTKTKTIPLPKKPKNQNPKKPKTQTNPQLKNSVCPCRTNSYRGWVWGAGLLETGGEGTKES